mmetsp:Transcript_22333/g.53122  ORF Transcript_22333/g.53122 Transcript_22333/m.53122 type:complete len:237 (+) Transcript_22333:1084-1794(+)
MYVVFGRIGNISHHQEYAFEEFLSPFVIKVGNCCRCLNEIAVMKVMVIVVSITEVKTSVAKGGTVRILSYASIMIYVASAAHIATPTSIVHKESFGCAIDPDLNTFTKFFNGFFELRFTRTHRIPTVTAVFRMPIFVTKRIQLFGDEENASELCQHFPAKISVSSSSLVNSWHLEFNIFDQSIGQHGNKFRLWGSLGSEVDLREFLRDVPFLSPHETCRTSEGGFAISLVVGKNEW